MGGWAILYTRVFYNVDGLVAMAGVAGSTLGGSRYFVIGSLMYIKHGCGTLELYSDWWG